MVESEAPYFASRNHSIWVPEPVLCGRFKRIAVHGFDSVPIMLFGLRFRSPRANGSQSSSRGPWL